MNTKRKMPFSIEDAQLPSDFDPAPLLDFMRFTVRRVPDEHRAEAIRIADEELAALGLPPLDPLYPLDPESI